MQYEMFFVPLRGGESEKDALNVFLRTRRVLKVDRQLQDGGWAFCVEWMPGPGAEGGAPASGGGGWSRPPKVDYREKLPPKQFEVFAKLRDARRRLAEAEGVQVYTVMTNEQLAEMVTRGVESIAEITALTAFTLRARCQRWRRGVFAGISEEGEKHRAPTGTSGAGAGTTTATTASAATTTGITPTTPTTTTASAPSAAEHRSPDAAGNAQQPREAVPAHLRDPAAPRGGARTRTGRRRAQVGDPNAPARPPFPTNS